MTNRPVTLGILRNSVLPGFATERNAPGFQTGSRARAVKEATAGANPTAPSGPVTR